MTVLSEKTPEFVKPLDQTNFILPKVTEEVAEIANPLVEYQKQFNSLQTEKIKYATSGAESQIDNLLKNPPKVGSFVEVQVSSGGIKNHLCKVLDIVRDGSMKGFVVVENFFDTSNKRAHDSLVFAVPLNRVTVADQPTELPEFDIHNQTEIKEALLKSKSFALDMSETDKITGLTYLQKHRLIYLQQKIFTSIRSFKERILEGFKNNDEAQTFLIDVEHFFKHALPEAEKIASASKAFRRDLNQINWDKFNRNFRDTVSASKGTSKIGFWTNINIPTDIKGNQLYNFLGNIMKHGPWYNTQAKSLGLPGDQLHKLAKLNESYENLLNLSEVYGDNDPAAMAVFGESILKYKNLTDFKYYSSGYNYPVGDAVASLTDSRSN